jgi:hypothetical protein
VPLLLLPVETNAYVKISINLRPMPLLCRTVLTLSIVSAWCTSRTNKMHLIPLVYFYCVIFTYMFLPVIRPSSGDILNHHEDGRFTYEILCFVHYTQWSGAPYGIEPGHVVYNIDRCFCVESSWITFTLGVNLLLLFVWYRHRLYCVENIKY